MGSRLVQLNRLMARAGLCSRREADQLVKSGRVLIDGAPAILTQRYPPEVKIEIQEDAAAEAKLSIMMHKPVGLLSQSSDPLPHQRFAIDLCTWDTWRGTDYEARQMKSGALPPARMPKMACAGRLDMDSSGLVIFTQDGVLARELVGGHEQGQIMPEKEYEVKVSDAVGRPLRDAAKQREVARRLSHGLHLDGQALRPCRVEWLQPGSMLRMVLTQGRKRQIRRMLELLRLECVSLHRTRIGALRLGGLPCGQWRFVERLDVLGAVGR